MRLISLTIAEIKVGFVSKARETLVGLFIRIILVWVIGLFRIGRAILRLPWRVVNNFIRRFVRQYIHLNRYDRPTDRN